MLIPRHLRHLADQFRKRSNRWVGPWRFRRAMASSGPRRLVIGAAGWFDRGWIPTDEHFLDLTKPGQWLLHFAPDSIDAMLAEHVWEHLTPDEALIAARTCYTYLKPGGYLRVAVPDGYHPSPVYQEWVRVGGAWIGQLTNDHKVLYTHDTVVALFEAAGFAVELYEYFDQAHGFHTRDWHPERGKIRRSWLFDKSNRDGSLTFTSIILDAIKPARVLAGSRAPAHEHAWPPL